jgi:hypothetical protein
MQESEREREPQVETNVKEVQQQQEDLQTSKFLYHLTARFRMSKQTYLPAMFTMIVGSPNLEHLIT